MSAPPVGPGRLSQFKRLLGWPLVILIFWFWWRSLQRLGVDWAGVLAGARGREAELLLALAGAAAYVVLQAVTWRAIVAGLVAPLPQLTALRLWTTTNFARYLPGAMWHLVGRVYLGKDAGVSRTTGALSVLLEQGLQLLGAVLLFVLTLPFWPSGTIAARFAWLIALVPLGLVVIHPRLFFPLLNAGLRLMRRELLPATLRYRDLLAYLGLYLVTHATNALALVFAVRILGGAWATMPAVVGAGMLAWTIGVISLLTPGGLGLREGLVTLVLGPLVGVDIAAVGAVLWRAANLLTEALCALLFSAVWWLAGRSRLKVSSPRAVTFQSPDAVAGDPRPTTLNRSGPGRWTDVAAIALILALIALFFWRLWVPNPADRAAFPIGDFTHQYYPLRRFVAASLAAGHLPFWNPFIFGGQPGMADPQAGVLYPPAVLNALLWGPRFPLIALELEAVAHIALAALGAYSFIRVALRLGVFPALTGGAVFGFGGYLTGFPIEQVTILESAAWLPWILLFVHLATSRARSLRRRAGWAATAALLLGLAVLAGHPQTALYLGYGTLAYALFRLGVPPRGDLRGWLRDAMPLAVIFPLGLALAAAQWLPTQAFIAESSRSSLDYTFARTGLGWDELLTLFVPQLVGSNPLYAGIGTLALALIALLAGLGRQQRFWLFVALLSLLLALGGSSFFFDLVYLGVPGFAHVRSQERALLLFAWALALFAGWGMAALLRLTEEEGLRARLARTLGGSVRWLPLLLVPLLAFWWLRALLIAGYRGEARVLDAFFEGYLFFVVMLLANWTLLRWSTATAAASQPDTPPQACPERSRRVEGGGGGRWAAPGLLLGLLLFDLFSVNRATHVGLPAAETLRPPQPLLETLQTALAAEPARVAIVGEPPINGNDGMRWDLPLLTGNEPLRLGNSKDFMLKVEPWRQFQLLNVGYVVADRDLAAEAPELYERLAQQEGGVLVRLRRPAPYAWLVGQTEILPGGRSEIRERLNEPSFDPLKVALFDEPEPAAGHPIEGAVTVEARAPGFVRLRASVPAEAILVVAEPFTKGWRATVDGRPVKVRRANLINAALALPPGGHVVILHYEQAGWRQGLAVSGISLAVVMLVLVLAWAPGERRQRPNILTFDHAPHAPRRPRKGRAALWCSLLLAGCGLPGPAAPPLEADFFTRTDPGEEAAAVPATVDFGDELRLLGFDLRGSSEGLVLITYWTALRPLDRELVPWPFFYDEARSTVLSLLPADALPALAERPVRSWQPGHVIRLAMPPVALGEPRDAGVGVAVIEAADPTAPRLTPRLGAATVVVRPIAGGTAVEIARIRAGAPDLERRRFEPPPMQYQAAATFGQFAALRGYDLRREDGAILLTVYWQALQPVDASLAVRAELLNADGHTLSRAESRPRVGRRPTESWVVGEIIADSYRLPVPAGARPHTVALTLFDPATGERIPARDDQGRPLPDDRARLPLEAHP